MVSILKDLPLFRHFSPSELDELTHLGENRVFEEHSNIIIEGELSWGLYVIIKGVVGVYKTSKPSGDLFDVAQLRQGSFFGEMSLVDQNPRSATVKAHAACETFYLSKEKFQFYLSKSAALKLKFYEACVAELVFRLRTLDEDFALSQHQLWKVAVQTEEAA